MSLDHSTHTQLILPQMLLVLVVQVLW